MPTDKYQSSRYLVLNQQQDARLRSSYASNPRAWKRDKNGRATQKPMSEFMADLLMFALDKDSTIEGSRLAIAGKFGEQISLKLDNLLLMLMVLINLICAAMKISNAQKNEAFRDAAADIQFEQRLIDLRKFYLDRKPGEGKNSTDITTKKEEK